MLIVQGLLAVFVAFRTCYCLPGGAPSDVCASMTPIHNFAEQSSPSPYFLNVVSENGQVKVKVGGTTSFQGIMIEARNSANVSEILDGTFSLDESSPLRTLDCEPGKKNAVTHKNTDIKNEVDVVWTPPSTFSGNVKFRVTVAKEFSTFWINQDSESVAVTASPVPSTASVVVTASPVPSTTIPAAIDETNIVYEGCNTRFGCFGSPENCVGTKSCQKMVKFITLDDDTTQFDLVMFSPNSGNVYVALGFSKDAKMGNDSVVACVNYESNIELKTGWNNEEYGNSLKSSNYNGFAVLEKSFQDGMLKCSFKHPIKWNMENVPFNLNKTTHLLLANGAAKNAAELGYHQTYKWSSTDAIEVLEFTQANADRLASIYENCGTKKGCYAEPTDCISSKDCKAFVSFVSHDNGVQFDLLGNSDGYVAVGLSNDENMGDDSVTACMLQNDVVQIKQSWNIGPPTRGNDLLNDEVSLSKTKGGLLDGLITCTFTRKMDTVIKEKHFNLNDTEYFLMLALGPVQSNGLAYHTDRWVSGKKMKLSSVSILSGSANVNLMIKIHGMLMIMAWIGTASIGMIFAGYFKAVWADKLLCGDKVWFFFHRMLMSFTFLLTVAAFVIIFIEIGGLSQVAKNPHPYLGIATTVLCVLQPFIALFRCAPDDSKRPIFRWLHWFVGCSAHILGVVTIFYSVELAKTNLPQYFDWILVAFVVFHVLFHIIFQTMECKNDGKNKKVADTQMTSYGEPHINQNEQNYEIKGSSGLKLTIIIYVFFNLGFIAALVALVWIS